MPFPLRQAQCLGKLATEPILRLFDKLRAQESNTAGAIILIITEKLYPYKCLIFQTKSLYMSIISNKNEIKETHIITYSQKNNEDPGREY